MSEGGTRARRAVPPRAVTLLVGALATVAALLALSTTALALVGPRPVWWHFLLTTGVFATASVASYPLRIGGQQLLVTFLDAALVLAMALLPLGWVVPSAALGTAVIFLAQRHQPIKAVYNVSMYTVAAGAATVLVATVAGPVDVRTLTDTAIILGASTTFAYLTDIGTAAVVGLSQRRSMLRVFCSGYPTTLFNLVGNLLAAVLVLLVVRYDVRLLVVLPVLLLCLRQAFMGQLRGREERESWQGLLRATQELSDLDQQVVLERAMAMTAEMFSADSVEIELTDGRLLRGDEDGVDHDGPAATAPERDAGSTIVERRLGGDSAPVGVLRLCFSGRVTLTDREQAMLGAVAAELHSALVNAAQHAKARHEASHDPLTDLLNRAGLLDAGAGWMADAAESAVDSALVLVDLTGFREIVDTLGHAAGDAVLVHTARRLTAAAMPGELVARLDGDDFAVLLPKLTDPTQATARTDALLGSLATPTDIGGAAVPVSGVAGIAYSVRGSVRLEELLRQAGVAVHAVRGSGGRIQYYAPERDVRSVSRVVLASEVRAALRGMGELDLMYQPILDLHSGEAMSAEALVRWNHPTRGMLLPDEFVPVVEHAGLLPELTDRVFDLALRNAATWARQGILVPVSVNVSPRTLLDRDFPGQVAAALSRHRVPAERVTLEITETSVLSHLTVVDLVLDELRDLGVRLSLDDFGTGWSSLSHLARVPVHEVKIAAAFTERILSSPQAAAVVRGTLEIGRALDLRVVAEGVTGAIQRATLISLGCHAGQGMYFFPPLSADRIGAALWSSTVRAAGASSGADVIPLSKRRAPHNS